MAELLKMRAQSRKHKPGDREKVVLSSPRYAVMQETARGKGHLVEIVKGAHPAFKLTMTSGDYRSILELSPAEAKQLIESVNDYLAMYEEFDMGESE